MSRIRRENRCADRPTASLMQPTIVEDSKMPVRRRKQTRFSARLVWLCVAVLVVGFCPAALGQASASLDKLAEEYWNARLAHGPQLATQLGDHRFNDRLDDLSPQARAKWQQGLRRLQGELQRVQTGKLSAEDRLTHALLSRQLLRDTLKLNLGGHMQPFDPLWGPHVRLAMLPTQHPFETAADFESYLTRLRGVPKQVSDLIANARGGLSEKVIAPRVIVDRVIPQLRAQLHQDPTKSPFYAPAEHLDVVPEEKRAAIQAELEDVIQADVVPSYYRLLAFLEDEYKPHARESVGMNALPRGDRLYEARIHLETTLRLKADELHQQGLEEVERLRGELSAVQEKLGVEGSVETFMDHLRTSPQYRFESPDQMLSVYAEILARAERELPKVIGRPPRRPIEMRPLEKHRADAAPAGFYGIAPDGSDRPAYFYLNTSRPADRLRITAEALTYHEAIPGHHVQMALAQENEKLPAFRQHARYSAFEEGWALYAEQDLGREIGGYATPEHEAGRLIFRLWRASRLVVDTGQHSKGWSRSQAIDYLMSNTAFPRPQIEAEVDRYIVWPGQALSYEVGYRVFRELRAEAEQTLGARFDERAFHDELLREGAMPLDLLEKRMNEWLRTQQAGQ
jgi:uncharacterized protein (DUF885 family)